MWFCCDLHLHSDRSSDCRIPAEQVVQAAAKRGVRLLAITDHHDLSAFRAARVAGRAAGVTVLPGVELSCPTGRSGVHVLGVFSPRLDIAEATAALDLNVAGLGSASGFVPYDVAEAVRRIHDLGGLAIAAHAKSSKGLLEECRGQTLRWILENSDFDAIELSDCRDPYREISLPAALGDIAVISGSDAHELNDNDSTAHPNGVGSRPFWASGPNPNFGGLRFAFSEPPGIDAKPTFDRLRGRNRIDQLLRVGDHFLKAVIDDAPARRDAIREAAIELLNGDGGFLLVGVRRRFQGATRGAALELNLAEIHDLVANSIYPSPVIRLRRHQAANGVIHELQFLASENPARNYEKRPRAEAVRAARADRVALERLGALSIKDMTTQFGQRMNKGALPMRDLVRLWPYRDWFSADADLTDLVGQSLAVRLADDERTPRWLRLWAREEPRARLHIRALYRGLAQRAATKDHRAQLRSALEESVRSGRLLPNQRRSAETWFERTQADILAGQPALTPAATDMDDLRERAERTFGQGIGAELATEAERAEAQYRAAMREAFGAQATVVLEVQDGDSTDDSLTVADLGVDSIILGGDGGGEGIQTVVVPDRLSRLNAPDLLELWSQSEVPEPAVIPGVVQRCVESGKHLPVLRFAAALDRAGVEQLIDGLSDIGAAQQRKGIIRDLAALLEPPAPAEAEPDYEAALARLDDTLAPDALKAAAEAALAMPDVLRASLAERPDLTAALRRAAAPGENLNSRRPAIVLAGLSGDRELLSDWAEETNHQVRLSLVEGIGLIGDDEAVDRVLFEALESKAGLVSRAARALVARGEDGYATLLGRLPPGGTERGYVVEGIRPISQRDPDHARVVAYRASPDATGPALDPIRGMDRHLHLDAARRRYAAS